MASWILILQLLLLPFAWASSASNLGSGRQLCAPEADTTVATTIAREKEGQRVLSITPNLNGLILFWVIMPLVDNASTQNLSRSSGIFLTYESVLYLHRNHFIPPPHA